METGRWKAYPMALCYSDREFIQIPLHFVMYSNIDMIFLKFNKKIVGKY